MASRPSDSGTAPQPLPRGRHKLTRADVRASQRERLLLAMEELVSEVGYEAASVPKVVARARVTGRTFYELFDDKPDCFIAVCERRGDEVLELLDTYAGAVESADDPFAVFDDGLALYLEWWTERPAGARAFFVELPAAGARAFASRDRRAALFAAALQRIGATLRRRAGVTEPIADVDATAAVVVATELVAREIRAGRIAGLPELHGDLRRVLLRLLVGGRAMT